jgi:RimJ/RimL family protein N-acetyltransferase
MFFERTTDYELVRQAMIEPHNWRAGTDDFAPAREDFRPLEHPNVWYIAVRDAGELLGIFVLLWHSPVLVEIHTRLLPAARGRARQALAGLVDWIWTHTGAARIVTSVIAGNCLALKLGRDTGFVEYGVNPASCQKDGRLRDQHLLGIGRPLTN